jgi:hypothetical protein
MASAAETTANEKAIDHTPSKAARSASKNRPCQELAELSLACQVGATHKAQAAQQHAAIQKRKADLAAGREPSRLEPIKQLTGTERFQNCSSQIEAYKKYVCV